MSKVKVRIDNDYEDGHHSDHVVDLPAPEDDQELDEWFEEVALPQTGDGHGIGRDLGYCYEATILCADDLALVGQSREWSGK